MTRNGRGMKQTEVQAITSVHDKEAVNSNSVDPIRNCMKTGTYSYIYIEHYSDSRKERAPNIRYYTLSNYNESLADGLKFHNT